MGNQADEKPELKETHLGQQLKNPLGSRTSSSTTLKPDDPLPVDESTATGASVGSSGNNGIGMSIWTL